MKIGFVCPDDLSINNYAKSFIVKLNEAREGHELVTICQTVRDYLERIADNRVRHIEIKMDRFLSPVRDIICGISLYNLFRREKFDVIINWTTKPNILGAMSAKLAKVPKVAIAIRGLGGAFLPTYDIKGKSLQRIVTTLYRISCKLSDKVWFTNRDDMEYFLQGKIVSAEKTILTKNAINIDDFSVSGINSLNIEKLKNEFRIKPNDKIVVMVARMIWSKGIREFVEASKIVNRKIAGVRFILVAPLEEKQTDAIPESYIKENCKSCNLSWVGFRKDVKDIYAFADIAVLSSYYKEGGYPRALLEPMALRKPVITTDTPGCRGAVEDGKNGYLIPPKDSKALAEAIVKLLNNPMKCQDFGKYSREVIEKKFDDKIVAEKILAELDIITL